jgi:hypothetical protein
MEKTYTAKEKAKENSAASIYRRNWSARIDRPGATRGDGGGEEWAGCEYVDALY